MIAMTIYEGNSEIEEAEEIATILIDEIEIAMPMWTGDAKIEIGETMTIAMMICEGNSETGEIVTILTDETGIMTTLAGETEIAMPMWIGDVKTEIGETEMIGMMNCEENTGTEGIDEIMMTLADVTEIKTPPTGDVKTETGGIGIEMMNEEGRIETMSAVKIEMRTIAERSEKDRLMIQEMTLITDANNALKTMLR